ncbi:MAG: VTT domain-containing protein [Phycisphaerales bacterium]|nr:VTT domain-containing protein [Phycisphaerales bacterium]
MHLARRLGPASVLAVISATLPALGGFALVAFVQPVGDWLKSHESALVIYALGFAFAAGLALLPTYAQAILGGWAFGFERGIGAAMAGATLGGILGYLIARGVSANRVQHVLDEHARWRAVCKALAGGGFWKTLGLVTLIRLPPNSPFALSNLVMGATRVHFMAFIIGTAIGLAPRTALAVYGAAQAQRLDVQEPGSWMMFAVKIAAALVVVIIVGAIGKRALDKATAEFGK